MSKLDDFCNNNKEELFKFPHVSEFGVHNKGEKYIAVITTEVDDDINETYSGIDEMEKTSIKNLLKPYNVRFFPPLMLLFSEWLNRVPRRKNPITETTYCRQ